MMVTMKMVGNLIVCDDKNAVSLINPSNMLKVASIALPNQNCYLYSVYFHSLSKTIFLGFDDKKIIGIDSERYTLKSNMTMNEACLKFTPYHADPENFAIMACDRGIIKIFQPARNMISATFDIEQAIIDEQRQQNNDE